MLRFIARTRSKYPRCQAWIWLIISIICVLSSSKFWLVEWSTLRFIAVILCVLFLALLPTYSPQNRLNLREILRNDIYALVRGVGTVRFFNIFNSLGSYLKLEEEWPLYLAAISLYLYVLAVDVKFGVDEDIGLSESLIFVVYGQLGLPAWAIDYALNLLVIYKYLNPQAPVEVEHEGGFFNFFDFFDFEEEYQLENQLEVQVEIEVDEDEIYIDDDTEDGVNQEQIADVEADGGAVVMEGNAEAIVADEIAAVMQADVEGVGLNADVVAEADEIAAAMQADVEGVLNADLVADEIAAAMQADVEGVGLNADVVAEADEIAAAMQADVEGLGLNADLVAVADEIAAVMQADVEGVGVNGGVVAVADEIADVQAEENPWAYCVCTIFVMVILLLD